MDPDITFEWEKIHYNVEAVGVQLGTCIELPDPQQTLLTVVHFEDGFPPTVEVLPVQMQGKSRQLIHQLRSSAKKATKA